MVLGRLGDDWLMSSALDGVFLISVARRTIRCFVQDRDRPGWQDVFVRRVLPRVAMLFGATALHAAALAIDGGALLLLGASGAGKSTLSAALGHAGWKVLSDDIAILWNEAAPEVAPSTIGVCVWPDSRAALGLPDAVCTPMPGYGDKMRFVPGGGEDAASVPIRGIVFLARSDIEAPVLEHLSSGEGLIRAAQQRIRFNPGDVPEGETVRTFESLGAMVRSTPCHRLSYPSAYQALPRVAEALRGLLHE